MKRIYQTILVSIALLFCVQAAQAAMMPIAHDFANSSFVEVGGFDPDPNAVTGTAPPSGPGTHPVGELQPFGMKSASAQVMQTGDSYYETWFGFNLASAASVNLSTAGSVVNINSPTLDALGTILALYFGDVNNGALVDGRQNDNRSAGLVTSCLTFGNLAAGDYIVGVSIIENVRFVPEWETEGGRDEAYIFGLTRLNISVAAPSAVPVPAAIWLFGTALIGFVGMSRRRSVKT